MPKWNEDTGKLKNGFIAERKRIAREKLARERAILRSYLPADDPRYLPPSKPKTEEEESDA